MEPLVLTAAIEKIPLIAPFRITGFVWESLEVLKVSVRSGAHVGVGEAAGIYYKNELPPTMLNTIERIRPTVEAGLTRESLQSLLPPSGARNALDCALWDLESKVSGQPVWKLAGLDKPHPIRTTMTCGADTPEAMAAKARAYTEARSIKLKLTGDAVDADRVRAVRSARADVWLSVDANQGFTREKLDKLMPALVDARVSLIEQPYPIGQDALLDGFRSPIPIAADESVQNQRDVPGLVGRYSMINIKLDKCGGLTEGLAMARKARELGLDCMVGNMMGSSLAMAPAFLVGQFCSITDLDGPLFIKADCAHPVEYADGMIDCPAELWGNP